MTSYMLSVWQSDVFCFFKSFYWHANPALYCLRAFWLKVVWIISDVTNDIVGLVFPVKPHMHKCIRFNDRAFAVDSSSPFNTIGLETTYHLLKHHPLHQEHERDMVPGSFRRSSKKRLLTGHSHQQLVNAKYLIIQQWPVCLGWRSVWDYLLKFKRSIWWGWKGI